MHAKVMKAPFHKCKQLFIDMVGVAVVAAPPNYTQVYYYFPAQMTRPYHYYSSAQSPHTAQFHPSTTAFISYAADKSHGGERSLLFLFFYSILFYYYNYFFECML